MADQIRSFVWRMATNAKWYQLVALGLALTVLIQGAPSGGGGGA